MTFGLECADALMFHVVHVISFASNVSASSRVVVYSVCVSVL